MKGFIWIVFAAMVIASPYAADVIVDWQFPQQGSNFSDAERQALNDLVVRASREAEERHAQEKAKQLVHPSKSQQAMIVKEMYGE